MVENFKFGRKFQIWSKISTWVENLKFGQNFILGRKVTVNLKLGENLKLSVKFKFGRKFQLRVAIFKHKKCSKTLARPAGTARVKFINASKNPPFLARAEV